MRWDEKKVEVEKMETALSTNFLVNREKRNWMIVNFFQDVWYKVYLYANGNDPVEPEKLMMQEKGGLSSGVVWGR